MIEQVPYDIFSIFKESSVKDYFKTSTNPDYQNVFEGMSPNYLRDGYVYGDIRSSNYVSGSAGWIIKANGDVEFSNGTFRGTLAAATGTIGGFTIGATSLTATTTGSIFQTASSGTRLVISNNRVTSYVGSNIASELLPDALQIYTSAGVASAKISDLTVKFPNSGIEDIGGAVYPAVTATHNLGLSSRRWNTVYCVATDISSDERIKKNITPLDYGLAEILQLEAIQYRLKFPGQTEKPEKSFGFSAQAVAKIMPEMTSNTQKGSQIGTASINYTEFIPVLVNAIKELSATVDNLRARLEAIEAHLVI